MTWKHTGPFSRHDSCPSYSFRCPSPKKGRRESRALTAPAAPCAKKKTRTRIKQVQPRHPDFPRAMVLRLIRALPGERRLLSPLPCQHGPAGIDATVAAPGPHDFAVRCRRYVQRANSPDATASIASRTNVRDDRETSPLVGAG